MMELPMVPKQDDDQVDRRQFLSAGGLLLGGLGTLDVPATPPVPDVSFLWDPKRAFRETTPTRERVCINGLWRWQPAKGGGQAVPADGWGMFKVPGFWPGISNYIQEDCQTVHVNESWNSTDLRGITEAWYQREI